MLRILLHVLLRGIFRFFHAVHGVSEIKFKQCIVVANHNTHLDVFALSLLFPLRSIKDVRAVAAKEYFSKGFLGFIAGYTFNLLLIERRSGHIEKDPLREIREALKNGSSLIIFPEGTRGKPGEMQKFKTGIGQIALEFPDMPIIPVTLSGIEKSMPRGSLLPVPFNLDMQVHSPVYGHDYLNMEARQARQEVTLKLQEVIIDQLKD